MGQPEGSGTTACDWICISWFFHSFCIIFYRSPPSLSQLWKVQGGCLFSGGEGIILWRTTILLMLRCLPNCGNCFYFNTSIFFVSSLCGFYTFDCLDFKKVNCLTHGTISSSFLWEPIRLPKIYSLILGKTEVPLLASPMTILLLFIVCSWLMLLLPLELPVFAVNVIVTTIARGYCRLCF